MTEGKVFITTWERTDTGYRVWVKKRPKIVAEGATFREADRLLTQAIGLATGDGENVHEYVPSAPADVATGGTREAILVLGIQASAEMGDPAGLFEGGLCPNCLMPRGPRSQAPLRVARIGRRVQAATLRLPRTSPGVGPALSVFSGEFLAMLTSAERAAVRWRPVVPPKSSKQEFFELLGGTVQAPYVALKDQKNYHGRCETCGWTWMVPAYVRGAPLFHLSAASLPAILPSLLVVGTHAEPTLAATPSRWQELVEAPAMKDIKTSLCSIVNEDAIERPASFEPRARESRAETAPAAWFE